MREQGLRDRKKQETRDRLADAAARLFAEHGYDAVAVVDVARAADVSDQTVYNYFPAKHELVLDRADRIRERYGRAVRERATDRTPAAALRELVDEDIARYRAVDLTIARGEFPTQTLRSAALRRYALEAREGQVEEITAALLATDALLHPVVVRAHAAALVSVIQSISDMIGARIHDGVVTDAAATEMTEAATAAFDELDAAFSDLRDRAGRPRTSWKD
ncbi:TetR/AcrR family transcriptional regulator [Clavibacter sp. VKM Ac-2873]|uniref:TetR/AcrR family transcriptional regulator n=1 Tax=Clavibacter sp. VKM Ac-2873 TaxID=2783813 RepID=UPI001889DD66|nr:TetR/AcrR family transcriptional regulator [Clavibacter sp. VKM Ac-2873]MBF4619263.1 TetR/AcrR family transcriptional regulator [Clavibacter sp. VKM Ac-2873]